MSLGVQFVEPLNHKGHALARLALGPFPVLPSVDGMVINREADSGQAQALTRQDLLRGLGIGLHKGQQRGQFVWG